MNNKEKKIRIGLKMKTISSIIEEIKPNFDNIVHYARKNGTQPFKSNNDLKKWLINVGELKNHNQEIYEFFKERLPKT